jgi:predicted peptidase
MKNTMRFPLGILMCGLVFTACKKTVEEDPLTGKPATEEPVIPVESAAPGNQYNNKVETKPAVQKGVTYNVSTNIAGFQQALPYYYDSTTKKYPLIIFCHGVGEQGNGSSDLGKVANNGVPGLIKNKKFPPNFVVNSQNFSFVVLSPQFKVWPNANDLNALVTYAIKKYRIDSTRIYVTGLSMGGGETWDFAGVYASRIAAIVPMCGASVPDDKKSKVMATANLPVWAFHNLDDYTVPADWSKSYVAKINSNNPVIKAKLTTFPTGGHNVWSKASDPKYKEGGKNIYEWMLQYTRKK